MVKRARVSRRNDERRQSDKQKRKVGPMYVAEGFDDCSEEVEKQPRCKRKRNPIFVSAQELAEGER